MQRAVITMLAHGISAGALFILCGEIYERLHTRDLRRMSGLWARFPYLPPITLVFAVASLGLPGMGNFVGEFLVLLRTFPRPCTDRRALRVSGHQQLGVVVRARRRRDLRGACDRHAEHGRAGVVHPLLPGLMQQRQRAQAAQPLVNRE